MLKKAKNLVLHPLLSGSFIMLVGTNLANFLAYIYHLIFGRLLGPSVYGELVAIMSLVGFFMSAFAFFGVSIVKFVSSGDKSQEKEVYSFVQKRLLLPVGIVGLFVFLTSPFISSFLKIDSLAVYLVGPVFFFAFLHQAYSSFLQGRTEFKKSVLVNNLGWVARILTGLLLFYFGFKLFGAFFAYFLGFVVAWYVAKKFVGFEDVKKSFDKNLQKDFMKYSAPVFIMTISISSFVTTDVVLAKHFLDAHTSGIYSSISTLGKIIYYAAFPIAGAMFPLVSEKASKEKGTKYIFLANLLLAGFISFGVLTIYWALPEFVVNTLYGSQYLQAAPFLLWFGAFAFLFSINYLIVNYFLSRGKTSASYLVLLGAVLQVIGIVFFHEGLMSIILVNLAVSLFVLVALIVYGLLNYGFVFRYEDVIRGVRQFGNEIQ